MRELWWIKAENYRILRLSQVYGSITCEVLLVR